MFKNESNKQNHFMNALNQLFLVIIVIFTLLFSSCKDKPTEVLDQKINLAIRSSNIIDEKEWNDMSKYIIDNKSVFPDLIEGETVGTKKLTNYILSFSHQHIRRGQTDPEIFSPEADVVVPEGGRIAS